MDDIDQGGFNNQQSALLDAGPAAALLGVKVATLYAYVSRGLLRSVAGEAGRVHRYLREDLLRLRTRAQARAGHGAVAASALHWGEPVLETAISSIDAGGPRYRGHPAVDLAQRGERFEAVAELLWDGSLPETPPRWAPGGAPRIGKALVPRGAPPVIGLALLVPALAVRDQGRFGALRAVELERARGLLLHLAAGLALGLGRDFQRALQAGAQGGVSCAVAAALGASATGAPALRALDQALVLMADHELNASTFVARVTASTGADLYACVGAALWAVSGPLHGGACDRVEALLAEALRGGEARAGDAAAAVHQRLRRGEVVPGFGHTLYPAGDPRTGPMLRAAQALGGDHPGIQALLEIADTMRAAGHPPPSVDVGLVALGLALGLPPGSAAGLFAVGRAAGWVAHALEQRQQPGILRPRAHYTG